MIFIYIGRRVARWRNNGENNSGPEQALEDTLGEELEERREDEEGKTGLLRHVKTMPLNQFMTLKKAYQSVSIHDTPYKAVTVHRPHL